MRSLFQLLVIGMGVIQFRLFHCSYRTLRITFRNRVFTREFFRMLVGILIGVVLAQLWGSSSIDQKVLHDRYISQRLQEAELNWHRSSRKIFRSEILIEENKFPNQDMFSTMENLTTIWDYFPPSFDCPLTKERVGRVGDGGKWICGMRDLVKRKNCVVYSFGVDGETSFEEEILMRTRCRVHMFDPVGNAIKLPVLSKFPGRVTYEQIAIGIEDVPGYKTLRTFMQSNGDEFADILKMDIEGSEFEVLLQIINDYRILELPFAQLQIELHLDRFDAENQYGALRSTFAALIEAGLRPFNHEPNLLWSGGMYLYTEFAFLNVKSPLSPFFLQQSSIRSMLQ